LIGRLTSIQIVNGRQEDFQFAAPLLGKKVFY